MSPCISMHGASWNRVEWNRDQCDHAQQPRTESQKPRNTEAQKHRNTETQEHGNPETLKPSNTETQTPRNTETQKPRNTETQKHRNTETLKPWPRSHGAAISSATGGVRAGQKCTKPESPEARKLGKRARSLRTRRRTLV